MPNILLVEDDAALSELIASYLERNGYHVSVLSRGDHVRERARLNPPDLVILDLMLPGLDGLQVCRLLRADSAGLPILMLTARDDSHDQVLGLEMGADDYVTKPFSPREVCARVRVILRRSQPAAPQPNPVLVLNEEESLDRTVDTHIKTLRQKLKSADAQETIVTHRGLGYELRH